jgi:hypothetical protein
MRLQRLGVLGLIMAFVFLLLLAINTIRPAVGGNAPLASIIPSQPPRAELISFGPLNGLGEATVTGAPGAVLPSAHVFLVNLDTSHQDHVMSAADGSFSARIFAPPGSNILIKHGPDHQYWHIDPWEGIDQGSKGFLTIFPSTTIYRPHEHSAEPNRLPLAAAGAIDVDTEAMTRTIGAAWTMTGTVGPVNDLHPGETITAETTIRLYSPAISDTTDVSTITLQIDPLSPWLMLFDDAGNPLPYMNQAGSNRLTPTGFPILDGRRAEVAGLLEYEPVEWQFKGGHIIEGSLTISMSLDASMPPGVYRPVLTLHFDGLPSGADSDWRAAVLSWMAGWPAFTFNSNGAALPPLEVKAQPNTGGREPTTAHSRRLIWYLQMDNASLGIRGAGAFQDREVFQPSSFVVNQGAPYILPPLDSFTGEPAVYRLEPYLPMISYGRGAEPGPPLIPFNLPGGQLCVVVHEPDGQQRDLGCEAFAQSISGDRSTLLGELLNYGAIEVSEYYGLTTANQNFAVTFDKPGYHLVEMHGWLEDVWGNVYEGGGAYEVWVAHTLDADPGLLPGTPLALGEALNPTVQVNPRLPAYVNLTVRHFPYSDPGLMQTYVVEGWANRFGTFAPDGPPVRLNEPGEYRLDLFAEYVDPESGEMYAAGATWGGVVMTPPEQAQLVVHGRRGSDNHSAIPNRWFVFCDPNLQPPLVEGSTPHLLNTYLNGDILWTYDIFLHDEPDCIGDALMMNASLHDTVGTVEAAITERYQRAPIPVAAPGNFEQRALADALPLFSSTSSGGPVSLFPEETDQIAYAYLSSQRPGVRVRETVSEDLQGSGYWRLDQMYDNQPGAGVEGDLPNDFKYQFVGAVYRDLESGLSEYLGQGSGWVHLPYSDSIGTRVMPPFSGDGNGGWPATGGPIMTLKGEAIDMFILPTGVRPGAVLQLGDRFDFGGYLMPTLDSRVQVVVKAPNGMTRIVEGRANRVGYFYEPEEGFVVDEPGRWTARVTVWHDGQIGSGAPVNCDPADPFDPTLPCPSGDVLGSADGQYAFYVVPPESPRLELTAPARGRRTFGEEVQPIPISGIVPAGMTDPVVDYTISMPGFILEEGQAQIAGDQFSLIFDPQSLHEDFPSLDLTSYHGMVPGLADTFSVGLLLTGQQQGLPVFRATTLTIQGDRVYVENADDVDPFQHRLYLPVIVALDGG